MELKDKTILITGSTDGMGKLIATDLAKKGATILLHGRNKEKGEKVLEEVKSESNNEKLYYYNANLASLEEVRQLAEQVSKEQSQLNILINNAGVGGGPKSSKKRDMSKDGYELRFAVNYLSHFLLIYKLLPLLKKSVPARIINVASMGQAPIDFNNVMLEKDYEGFRAYRQSKLAQIMFTITLADELKDSGIIVNSLHPASLMDTNMVHEYFDNVMSKISEGAEVVEYVATADETDHISGAYFDQKTKAKANEQAYDAEARKKLQELSFQLTGLD